ncbi:uncharacterized protein LOC134839104 isoform X2 [Symsagittifera roscoffensis]|uniref:uncharacterized protein LOC134839104 isoform X2 n=1 Tax=Symsagittifera roscoffensis TaxID=84072 RepID=UPI00307C325E
MNAAQRKKCITEEMKKEATCKLAKLETLKIRAINEISFICSSFIETCTKDLECLQSLVNYEETKNLSFSLDQKITRMSNYLTELSLHCQEMFEKDGPEVTNVGEAETSSPLKLMSFKELKACPANSKAEVSICDLPSLADLNITEGLEFLELLETAYKPKSASFEQTDQFCKAEGKRVISGRKVKPASTELEQHATPRSSDRISSHSTVSEHQETSCSKPPPPFSFKHPKTCPAVVTHVECVNLFYVQLTEMRPHLDNLDAQMTKQMFDGKEKFGTLLECKVGGPAVVYSNEFKNFFRAWTRRILSDSNIEVFYIDWGNTDIVPLENCYTMPERFSSLPAGTIPCCLQKRQTGPSDHVEYTWSLNAKTAFSKSLLNKVVKLSILRLHGPPSECTQDPYHKVVYDVTISQGANNEDMFEKLLSKNYKPLCL